MVADDLREALIQLEDAMGIGRPIGATELPDEIRFFRILTSLRDILCPRLGHLVQAADTKLGDLAAIITDCIVSAVGKVPVPAATVAKHVAGIGFDRFCSNPTSLLKSDSKPSEEAVAAEDSDAKPDAKPVPG